MTKGPHTSRVVADYFRVGEVIGSGSMGDVYVAAGKHGEEVAIKFLRRELADDPDVVRRFQRESAVVYERLRSRYVAAVLGSGSEGGHLWIAFERLHGETFEERLRRRGRMTPAELWPLVADVYSGLHDAHAVDVVHRDIKPANLFIEARRDGSESARILDFGVSKRIRTFDDTTSMSTLTGTDEPLGTFNYMPPEQWTAVSVTPRADLYAMGCVIYRCLSGELPFVAPSAALLRIAKETRAPRSLRELGIHLGDGLDDLLMRSMATRPEDRFATAEEARTAWLRALPPRA